MGDIEAVADVRIIGRLLIIRADARTVGGAASAAERQSEVDRRRADDLELACDAAEWLGCAQATHLVLAEWGAALAISLQVRPKRRWFDATALNVGRRPEDLWEHG